MHKILVKLSLGIISLSLLALFINVMGNNLSEQILKYLMIIISWPVVVFLMALIFKDEMANFINRIVGAKFPGGEIQTAPQLETPKSQDDNITMASPQNKELVEQIREEYEERFKNYETNIKATVDSLFDEISKKDLELEFERIYNLIFGSQVRLLEILLPNSGDGLPRNFMDSFFNNVKSLWSNLATWNTDSYLGYLIGVNLIEMTTMGNYKITSKGEGFLSYITSRNYLKKMN